MKDGAHEVTVEIKNADGLHMRPAMHFVDVASTFKSDIQVTHGDTTADAKSIMQMTMLAAACGAHLTIRARGPDAAQAIEVLREVVEQGLSGEPSQAADERGDG